MGSSPISATLFYHGRNINRKKENTIKQISKKDMNKLLSKGIIKNTNRGFVDKNGNSVGFYRTSSGKRYIQDNFVNMIIYIN